MNTVIWLNAAINLSALFHRFSQNRAQRKPGIDAALIDARLPWMPKRRSASCFTSAAPCAVPVIGEEQQYVGIISKRMLLQALDREGQTMADQSNPWGTTEAADSAAQSADAWGSTPAPADGGGAADWLNNAPAPAPEHFNIMDPFHKTLIPRQLGNGGDRLGGYPFPSRLPGIRAPVDYILNGFQQLMLACPRRWRLCCSR